MPAFRVCPIYSSYPDSWTRHHFSIVCVCVCVCVCVYSDAQSCPTFCEPMDCTPPGSSVHGILQARMLEWVAISFSRGSSQPRNRTRMSCIAGGLLNYRRILYCLSYKGGDLPKMREASTEEPALDPSLLLSCCCPSFRFSLTHFPSFSLGYIGSLCDGTSSRKPSLNCWVGSVPPRVSMAPVFPSVLQ